MSQLMDLKSTVLTGSLVVLKPLSLDLLEPLAKAAEYAEIWTYLDEETPSAETVAALIAEALEELRLGTRIPYVIIDRPAGEVIGSISFLDIQPRHRGVEIGWAWVTPKHWRTGAAREAAFLLMCHAFDDAGAIRVAFKTDSRNMQSQRAIENLGAAKEGVFRHHRILRDGYIRDSIFYSITIEEWPNVRHALKKPPASDRSDWL